MRSRSIPVLWFGLSATRAARQPLSTSIPQPFGQRNLLQPFYIKSPTFAEGINTSIPYQIHSVNIHQEWVRLCIPDQLAIKEIYAQSATTNPSFPYWAKLWPSSLALSEWLIQHPQVYREKTVHEIAAGLGLPGILAAREAASVLISDYDPEAVRFIEANLKLNPELKAKTCCINWKHPEAFEVTDILLLSDINYDPADYPDLYNLFNYHLNQQSCIILSTPERLQGRLFLETIAVDCIHHEVVQSGNEPIHILIYAKTSAATSIRHFFKLLPSEGISGDLI